MQQAELVRRLCSACAEVRAAEAVLTEIDSKFGDADHGLTMTKIMNTLEEALTASEGNIQEMLDDAAMAVMVLNGGSAVPLWNTFLDGLQEGAQAAGEMDLAQIQAMFASGFEAFAEMSGAKVGDKTMMDALAPACEAIASYTGSSEDELFAQAAEAALAGAEKTKNFKSKFGRAKSYGEKTIGTPDAGALSMAKFFVGLAH